MLKDIIKWSIIIVIGILLGCSPSINEIEIKIRHLKADAAYFRQEMEESGRGSLWEKRYMDTQETIKAWEQEKHKLYKKYMKSLNK